MGVDWLIAARNNFSSTVALRFAHLEGLPPNNTKGPVKARPLRDRRKNHSEQNGEERAGKYSTSRAPTAQHVKMIKQVRSPPAHVKERAYPKIVTQRGDAERYGELNFRIDETIFAAYDKAETRKAKILVIASSDVAHASKSLFWPT